MEKLSSTFNELYTKTKTAASENPLATLAVGFAMGLFPALTVVVVAVITFTAMVIYAFVK